MGRKQCSHERNMGVSLPCILDALQPFLWGTMLTLCQVWIWGPIRFDEDMQLRNKLIILPWEWKMGIQLKRMIIGRSLQKKGCLYASKVSNRWPMIGIGGYCMSTKHDIWVSKVTLNVIAIDIDYWNFLIFQFLALVYYIFHRDSQNLRRL